jgi:hypothetical protein
MFANLNLLVMMKFVCFKLVAMVGGGAFALRRAPNIRYAADKAFLSELENNIRCEVAGI